MVYGFGTSAVHAGQNKDGITGAVIPPISLSTTFAQEAPGVHKGFEYSRSNNPNRFAFETAVASLENGKYGLAYASGSAVTATIVTSIGTCSHIISVNDVYGGTYRYFTKVASTLGIDCSFVDLSNPENIKSFIRTNTKLVWIETPTNPTLKLADIKSISEITKQHNITLVVDNTFLSPYFQRPLELGADIVVHSVTKYLNGHSDVVMGVLVTNKEELYTKLKFLQNSIGAVPSPFDCFLANRGLKTLQIRMRKHAENAVAVAQFLESSPKVSKVIYPGLTSHSQNALAVKQQKGFGGMISFYIKGGRKESVVLLQSLKLFALAESLGGIESLAELPSVMTHASVSADDREKLGITDGLIRISVGIEEAEDLINDLKQALEKALG